jgi:hypothetical protein
MLTPLWTAAPFQLSFLLQLHGPSRKLRFQQYLYCCMRIHYHGNMFTEPLPRLGSGIQKLIGRIHRHTQTAWRSHKPTLIFFQNEESRLKRIVSRCITTYGGAYGLYRTLASRADTADRQTDSSARKAWSTNSVCRESCADLIDHKGRNLSRAVT